MVIGGVLAAIAIPAALTAWFAPEKVREARDYVMGNDEAEEELKNLSARLEDLNSHIEAQRDSAFDSVSHAAAANRDA